MKILAFCVLSLLLFSIELSAQGDSGTTIRFEKALEDQLSCEQKLDPVKAIRALQQAGVIAKKPYVIVDSLSYFRAQRPIRVFGFEVIAVIGFEYDSKVFGRGPGTAPGTSLGIVVPNTDVEAKGRLINLTSKNIMIQHSDDYFEPKGKNRGRLEVRTEIMCFGGNCNVFEEITSENQ